MSARSQASRAVPPGSEPRAARSMAARDAHAAHVHIRDLPPNDLRRLYGKRLSGVGMPSSAREDRRPAVRTPPSGGKYSFRTLWALHAAFKELPENATPYPFFRGPMQPATPPDI